MRAERPRAAPVAQPQHAAAALDERGHDAALDDTLGTVQRALGRLGPALGRRERAKGAALEDADGAARLARPLKKALSARTAASSGASLRARTAEEDGKKWRIWISDDAWVEYGNRATCMATASPSSATAKRCLSSDVSHAKEAELRDRVKRTSARGTYSNTEVGVDRKRAAQSLIELPNKRHSRPTQRGVRPLLHVKELMMQ